MKVVSQISPNSLVVFSGLVPRPMDYPSSKVRCENYRSIQLATEELCREKGWNCTAVLVFNEFIDRNGNITESMKHFVEGLYLTQAGIRKLRAIWLRHLGYFPKKATAYE